jgi:mRNA interferase YafQ
MTTMKKYEIHPEKNYRKQYKLLQRRDRCASKAEMPALYALEVRRSPLDDVVLRLANGEVLPEKYSDHPLTGDRRGYRDCHVKGDWVLIYKIQNDVLTLILSETGTHSDILE